MTIFTWRSGASDPWTTLADWLVGTVPATALPAARDTVQIGSGTLSVQTGLTVSGLQMIGSVGAPSVIDGGAMLIATGAAVLNGVVVQSGAGTTLLEGATALTGGATAGTLYLDGGRLLQNAGTLSLSDGVIELGALPSGPPAGGATLGNTRSGTILVQETGTVVAGGAGGTSVINSGRIVSQASGDAVLATLLQNSGTLVVASGTLTLQDGGVSTGPGTEIDSGATLELSGGAIQHCVA
jgi:hypothetical protein